MKRTKFKNKTFTHGSLFSGIGGFDLASQWMGWENVFSCEINPFGRRVLEYYWPNTTHYEDITKTDWLFYRGKIDILTGGFPCQPFSLAGKRKGTEDDRNLWPDMLRAIQAIQPGWVVGENVYGIVNWNGGLVFEQVQSDLEAEGYEVQPIILPACAVNAPHRRDRTWFVAYSKYSGYKTRRREEEEKNGVQGKYREAMGSGESDGTGISSATPDTEGLRINREKKHENSNRQSGKRGGCNINDNGEIRRTTSNTEGERQPSQQARTTKFQTQTGQGLHGRSSDGQVSGFEQFPTQSPVCSRNDEFSARLDGITFPKWRNESIKAYGNAVVPQLVYEIFKVIQEMEDKFNQ